jgi:photosystem II stability/assembly factor-like uncharacterized protein
MRRALAVLSLALCLAVLAVLALGGLGAPGPAGASAGGDPAWQPSAPLPRHVRAIAVARDDPNIVLAGTPAGLYHSTDGGRSWQLSTNRILSETDILALSASPTEGCTFYAVTIFDGIFRSNSCGYTWVRLAGRAADPFPGLPLRRGPLGVPQLHYYRFEQIVHAPAGGIYLAGETVAYSADGGATWQERGDGLPAGGNVLALDVDPQQPGRLYAAVFTFNASESGGGFGIGGGLFRSGDGGLTWTSMTPQVPLPSALVLDARQPSVLIAGTYSDGIHRSTDAGATWQHIAGLPRTLGIARLVAAPGAPGTLVAAAFDEGVYRTSDAGQTWQPVNEGLPAQHRLRQLALAASPDGVVAYVANDVRDADGFRLWRRTLSAAPAPPPVAPPASIFRAFLPIVGR